MQRKKTLKVPASLIRAIKSDNEQTLKKELENKKYKVNPELLNTIYESRLSSMTPLIYAVMKNCFTSCKVLALNPSIDLNTTNLFREDIIILLCIKLSDANTDNKEIIKETLKIILTDKRYSTSNQRHANAMKILIKAGLFELAFLLMQKETFHTGDFEQFFENPLFSIAAYCPQNMTDHVLNHLKLNTKQLASFMMGAFYHKDASLALKILEFNPDSQLAEIKPGSKQNSLFVSLIAIADQRNSLNIFQPVLKKLLCQASPDFWKGASGSFAWLAKLSTATYHRVAPIVINDTNTIVEKSGLIEHKIKPMLLALLADPDFDINSPLWTGEFLLSQAIINNDIEIALLALENAKLQINLTNENLETAFAIAAKLGRSEIIAAMLTKPDLDIYTQNSAGHTPVMLAFENQHGETGNLILAHDRFDPCHIYAAGQTLAMHAAAHQQDGLLDYLFSQGAPVDATDAEGNTALNIAVASSDSAVVLNVLFKHNANPHIANHKLYTPVMTAQQHGHNGLYYPITERMRTYKPTQITNVAETFFNKPKGSEEKYHDLLKRLAQ